VFSGEIPSFSVIRVPSISMASSLYLGVMDRNSFPSF
jgi:hypothetical protein